MYRPHFEPVRTTGRDATPRRLSIDFLNYRTPFLRTVCITLGAKEDTFMLQSHCRQFSSTTSSSSTRHPLPTTKWTICWLTNRKQHRTLFSRMPKEKTARFYDTMEVVIRSTTTNNNNKGSTLGMAKPLNQSPKIEAANFTCGMTLGDMVNRAPVELCCVIGPDRNCVNPLTWRSRVRRRG